MLFILHGACTHCTYHIHMLNNLTQQIHVVTQKLLIDIRLLLPN